MVQTIFITTVPCFVAIHVVVTVAVVVFVAEIFCCCCCYCCCFAFIVAVTVAVCLFFKLIEIQENKSNFCTIQCNNKKKQTNKQTDEANLRINLTVKIAKVVHAKKAPRVRNRTAIMLYTENNEISG